MAEECEAALAFGICLSTRSSIPMPNKALTAEPASTPIFAVFKPCISKGKCVDKQGHREANTSQERARNDNRPVQSSRQFRDTKSNGDPAESNNP